MGGFWRQPHPLPSVNSIVNIGGTEEGGRTKGNVATKDDSCTWKWSAHPRRHVRLEMEVEETRGRGKREFGTCADAHVPGRGSGHRVKTSSNPTCHDTTRTIPSMRRT